MSIDEKIANAIKNETCNHLENQCILPLKIALYNMYSETMLRFGLENSLIVHVNRRMEQVRKVLVFFKCKRSKMKQGISIRSETLSKNISAHTLAT